MKTLFFVLILPIVVIGRLTGQSGPTLVEQRNQLLQTSVVRLTQLNKSVIDLSLAKKETENEVNAQINAARQATSESYNQASGAIRQKRSDGTQQDISLLGSMGSLQSGAGLALLNMVNRKSKLSDQTDSNESQRKAVERHTQQIQEQKLAAIQNQFSEQLNNVVQPFVQAMNAFFGTKPPTPRLPNSGTDARQTSMYVYFGQNFFDRIIFSEVWRLDRTSNGTWTAVEMGQQAFVTAATDYSLRLMGQEPQLLEVADNTMLMPVFRFILANGNYTHTDVFTMGAFASPETALQHQLTLMRQALKAGLPVQLMNTPPQVSLTDTKQFVAQQNEYWGVSRRAGQVGIAQENRTTQEVAVVRKQSTVRARVEAAPPARVSAGASTKSDDFWGEGDAKNSVTTTPASRGKRYRQTDSDLTVRVQIEQDTLEVIESADRSIVPLGIYRRNQRGSYEQQTNAFSPQTDQLLMFTNGQTTLNLTLQP